MLSCATFNAACLNWQLRNAYKVIAALLTGNSLLQVAQGLLDYMNSVLDTTQQQQRQDLDDLLLLHGVNLQHAQQHKQGNGPKRSVRDEH